LKLALDAKVEAYTQLEKRGVGIVQYRQKAKLEMDQAEVMHYEANLTYNIMIINMVYDAIPRYKGTRRLIFANMLK